MAEPEAPARSATPAAAGGIANPAPLGLAAFALTTFLLSASNAGLTDKNRTAWIGCAVAYGGLAQLLAGMWEMRAGNTFGATAFSSYGAFWLGLFVSRPGGERDLGAGLLALAIFNPYMLYCSMAVNMAVFGVFLTLQLTEIVLFIANFSDSSGLTKVGGWIGIITALVAWYASFAGVAAATGTGRALPVGRAMR